MKNTQKVAITMPIDLVTLIDTISKQRGISRSKFISNFLREKISEERDRAIKEAYDRIFSDDSISREQLETANWFESSGSKEGQEW